jgi:hypothetical protein
MPDIIRTITQRIPSGTALGTVYVQPDGTATTGAASSASATFLGVDLPAAWTAAVLTLQASRDGVTWLDVYDRFGAEVTLQAAASRRVVVEPSVVLGVEYLRVRSGTAGAPVNQGADRDVVLLFRQFD